MNHYLWTTLMFFVLLRYAPSLKLRRARCAIRERQLRVTDNSLCVNGLSTDKKRKLIYFSQISAEKQLEFARGCAACMCVWANPSEITMPGIFFRAFFVSIQKASAYEQFQPMIVIVRLSPPNSNEFDPAKKNLSTCVIFGFGLRIIAKPNRNLELNCR